MFISHNDLNHTVNKSNIYLKKKDDLVLNYSAVEFTAGLNVIQIQYVNAAIASSVYFGEKINKKFGLCSRAQRTPADL